MRKLIILSAVAPLALLAACGDNATEADTAADPADTAMMDTPEPAPVAATPTTLADAGDFSGRYNMAAAEGATSASAEAGAAGASTASTSEAGGLMINSADDSYEYTDVNGTVKTGKFSRMGDNYRIMIEDFNGQPGYFAISNGDLYRMSNDTAMDNTINVTGERYTRNRVDNGGVGPGATTNSVSDKRGETR